MKHRFKPISIKVSKMVVLSKLVVLTFILGLYDLCKTVVNHHFALN